MTSESKNVITGNLAQEIHTEDLINVENMPENPLTKMTEKEYPPIPTHPFECKFNIKNRATQVEKGKWIYCPEKSPLRNF